MAVWEAAEATYDALYDLGMDGGCFIGSLAANLHGNDREPNVSIGSTRNVDSTY